MKGLRFMLHGNHYGNCHDNHGNPGNHHSSHGNHHDLVYRLYTIQYVYILQGIIIGIMG